MRIDHVIFGVSDLDAAARRFERDHGLRAGGGGEHPALGTRNAIVPVGDGQYVELMAVADPDAGHPLPAWLTERIADGDRPVAVCLRPDSLDEIAERLSLDPVPGERHNPDGEVLRWRLAGLEAALGPARLPFFIDWGDSAAAIAAQLAAGAQADGIEWIEYGGDPARLAEWVGGAALPFRLVDGEPGPRAVGIRRGGDTVVIR